MSELSSGHFLGNVVAHMGRSLAQPELPAVLVIECSLHVTLLRSFQRYQLSVGYLKAGSVGELLKSLHTFLNFEDNELCYFSD